MEIELGSQRMADLAKQANENLTLRRQNQEVAVDGQMFRYIQSGSFRTALIGPDEIVYKVPFGAVYGGSPNLHVQQEISLFRHAAKHDFSWVPDFCVYETVYETIVAMPLYEQYPSLNYHSDLRYWWREQDNTAIRQMQSFIADDVYPKNLGINSAGDVVLLDGGCSHV